MSAIWGQLSYHNSISESSKTLMLQTYKRKCKLDRILSKDCNHASFSCGIQEITSESKNEILPIEDNECIFTADCIIDNREELISRLGQAANHSSAGLSEASLNTSLPDGKLFYLAYKCWGTECFPKLEGLYSVAILEKSTDTLYLAVDKMSYRCLYCQASQEGCLFSTLLEPIVKSLGNVSINDFYMKDFLTSYGMLPNLVEGETPYQNIFQVKAGTFLTITRGSVRETEYWNPSMSECKWSFGSTSFSRSSVRQSNCFSSKKVSGAEYVAKEFREVYTRCVQRAVRTCGEVGSALSSGFDSASASSIAADLLAEQNKELYTYTYIPYEAFDKTQKHGSLVFNEKEDVLKIVSMHPNMVPTFLCNDGRNCLENLSVIQDVLEIPYKAFVNMPNLNELYGKAAAQGCKVVLLGQCGNSTVSFGLIDDVLYELYINKHYIKLLTWLNRYSKTIGESRKKAIAFCLSMYRDSAREYANDRFVYKLSNPLISPSILDDYPLEERYRQSGRIKQMTLPTDRIHFRKNLYSKSMYAYLGAIETKLGLYNGVILRDPTRDPEMISFCYHMPFEYFAYRGKTRWLIREALSNLLPTEIISDYLRYSFQNNDWLDRMNRDKESLLKMISDVILKSSYLKYFDYEKANGLLTNLMSTEDWNEMEFMQVMYLFMEAYFEMYSRQIV